MAIWSALMARLYLKVKLYVTNLLSVYNLQKISCLKWNNFVWIFIFLRIHPTFQGRRNLGGRGDHAPSPLFCVAKRKKEAKGKKERVSKQKLLKGCRQDQNVIVLAILERLEFENFSCRPTMVADNTFQCSMATHSEIHFAGPSFKTYL